MKLWIRSTAKTNLINVRFITIIQGKKIYDKKNWEYEGYTIANVFNDKYEILGTYKTKERALEVLDEIQEAQLGNYHYRCPSNVKVSNNEDIIVYEMPKE